MKGNASLTSSRSTSASSTRSENSFSSAPFPQYQELTFVRKLSETKFPVYQVFHSKTYKYYAIKIFPWEDNSPSPFFLSEIRFAQFECPHIVPMISYEFEQTHVSDKASCKFSYILMEFAHYGDFFDALMGYKISLNDKLIRTYFHQLVKGVETLHMEGAAHLDLKLENLLMSEDFTLKVTDFDLSYLEEDEEIQTMGTKNFRAPEILNRNCSDPQAADIYSMGVVLFQLKTGGNTPYSEDETSGKLTMKEFQELSPKAFWEKQCQLLNKKPSFFSEDFKSLFIWMTKNRPEERPTLAQVKKSKWFNGETYSEEEFFDIMSEKFEECQ